MTPVQIAAMPDEIQGWGLPFHGPADGRDLQGSYFSKRTDFALDWYAERPLLVEHGLDPAVGGKRVGTVTAYKATDYGIWVRAILDRRSEYYAFLKELVARGALSFSSGAVGNLVRIAASGEITRWPWVELSLTPTPANPTALLGYTVDDPPRPQSPAAVEELRAIAAEVKAGQVAELEAIRENLQQWQRQREAQATFNEFLALEARMLGVPV